MAKIEYKPHCSKCGALIREEVAYETCKPYPDATSKMSLYTFTRIEPFSCHNCGEIFGTIEIKPPTRKELI